MAERSQRYKYRNITTSIAESIADGTYRNMLPSIKRLVQIYGVSRSTVMTAIKLLEGRGVLEARQGSGTYVIQIPETEAQEPRKLIENFMPQLHKLGAVLGTRTRITGGSYEEDPTPENFEKMMLAQTKIATFFTLAEPLGNLERGDSNRGLIGGREHLLIPLIRQTFSTEFTEIRHAESKLKSKGLPIDRNESEVMASIRFLS